MYNDSFKLRYQSAPLAVDEKNDYTVTYPHIHNEIEVLYIEKGKTDVKISDFSSVAQKGDIIFVNPLEVHTFIPHKDEEYKHKCLCFDTSLVADKKVCEKLVNGNIKIDYHLKGETKITDLFLKIYDAVIKNEDTLMFESMECISGIFCHLMKNQLLKDENKSQKSEIFCHMVMEYISKNFDKQITSADVAEQFFYTQSYFCRIFNENFGVSFSNYLNIYRIYAAKQMLEKTDKKISDIAYECGFLNPEYFTKTFKKYTGKLPSDYKKSQYSTKNVAR
ncbi:MAG: AraC family transcriptional regulator [Ruminococcaceae bacterium]|nr:AraC family transcriptional regulator [Oscillospiraceae bacterium]